MAGKIVNGCVSSTGRVDKCINELMKTRYIGCETEEETNKLLHLEHSFVWCRNVDASGSRSETPGKF
jgi:hypothetical protein